MPNVDSLASLLKDHSKCTLTELNLRHCHISSESEVELAAALRKNLTLKLLYVDYNPIGVEGASSMSDMLQHNTSLDYLYLHDEPVREEGVRQLVDGLTHNQTLIQPWLPEKYKSETSDHRIRWSYFWVIMPSITSQSATNCIGSLLRSSILSDVNYHVCFSFAVPYSGKFSRA